MTHIRVKILSAYMRSPSFRSNKEPLKSAAALKCIQDIRESCEGMPIALETFNKLLNHIENKPEYHDAPYHNAAHYLCVTLTTLILSQNLRDSDALTPKERELLVVTAMVHDFAVAFLNKNKELYPSIPLEEASVILAASEGVLPHDIVEPVSKLNLATIFNPFEPRGIKDKLGQYLSDADLIQSAGLNNMLHESAMLSKELGFNVTGIKGMCNFLTNVGPLQTCVDNRNRYNYIFEENRLITLSLLKMTEDCLDNYPDA